MPRQQILRPAILLLKTYTTNTHSRILIFINFLSRAMSVGSTGISFADVIFFLARLEKGR
jgi:hypothetical protein